MIGASERFAGRRSSRAQPPERDIERRSGLAVVSPLRPWGPSYRVRVDGWLERTGIDAQYPAIGRSPRDRDARRLALGDLAYEVSIRYRAMRDRYERLLVQKEASRLGAGGLEERLLRRASFSIFDIDDAFFLGRTRPRSRFVGRRDRRARTMLSNVDRVVAGNDFLADAASAYCSDVVVIPTCIDPADYLPPQSVLRSGPVVIGWMGSSTTERYLEPLLPVLADLQRNRDIELTIVSAQPFGTVKRAGCDIVRRPWKLSTQAAELQRFDIGLAPLADTAWERGKCGYKLLQYGASSVPPVGSPVGVAGRILAGAEAPAPESLEEWHDALAWLIEDADARARIGAAANDHVAENYSYQAWNGRWIEAVLGGPDR